MEEIKQNQKAGDGAQQIQAGTIIVNQGVTEERVRNVFTEMIPQALKEYTKEAYEIATQRINKLEQNVIPRIAAIDGALESFADPAFQKLLRKAQQSAAATEREDDYALLSELLVCHIEKGNHRKNRAAISKAIEIIDDIDNDALCALTLAHAVGCYFPVTGDIQEGLKILDNLFSKLWYMDPPIDTAWLEHLDILRAVRISQFSGLNNTKTIYTKSMNGYSCIGIKVDSEEHQKAIEILTSARISPKVLIPNVLLEGYVRIPICNKETINKIEAVKGTMHRKLTEDEKNAIEKILGMYVTDNTLQETVDNKFMEMFDSYNTLRKLHIWWDSVPSGFRITQIGAILAHTNAKRCDNSLPDLM